MDYGILAVLLPHDCQDNGAGRVVVLVVLVPGFDAMCLHCGPAGQPITGEDDKHKSKIYSGPVCDSCFDMEK